MWDRFNGNGIFVFSDPAGAKACLALNEILKIENISGTRKLYSNKEYAFYKQFDSKVEIIENLNTSNIIGELDWIFAGTSHPDSSGGFELYMLKNIVAKTSFSFIDHWTNFALRFSLKDEIVIPTIIFVLDEKAKQLAIEDGLPEDKLLLMENPYLTYLKSYVKSSTSKTSFCNLLDISFSKKIILFAPDPISLRSSEERNEISILKELIEICNTEFTLLLKLHPLQPLDIIGKIISTNPSIKLIKDELFLPQDVFKNVDCIIGFYSNYLIEASTLNKNIIRYIFSNNQVDYLSHALSNNSIVVDNKKDLKFAIKNSCA